MFTFVCHLIHGSFIQIAQKKMDTPIWDTTHPFGKETHNYSEIITEPKKENIVPIQMNGVTVDEDDQDHLDEWKKLCRSEIERISTYTADDFASCHMPFRRPITFSGSDNLAAGYFIFQTTFAVDSPLNRWRVLPQVVTCLCHAISGKTKECVSACTRLVKR